MPLSFGTTTLRSLAPAALALMAAGSAAQQPATKPSETPPLIKLAEISGRIRGSIPKGTGPEAAQARDAHFRSGIRELDAFLAAQSGVNESNAGRLQRATLFLAIGERERAREDLEAIVASSPSSLEGPVGAVRFDALTWLCEVDPARARAVIAPYTNDPATAERAQRLLDRAEAVESTQVGKPLRPIEATTVTGDPFASASMKGRVWALVFWTSASKESIECLEAAERARRRLGAEKFAAVGICLDTEPIRAFPGGSGPCGSGPEGVRRFAAGLRLSSPQIYESRGLDSALARKLNVGSAPRIFLLDAAGAIRSAAVEPGELEAEAAALIPTR